MDTIFNLRKMDPSTEVDLDQGEYQEEEISLQIEEKVVDIMETGEC